MRAVRHQSGRPWITASRRARSHVAVLRKQAGRKPKRGSLQDWLVCAMAGSALRYRIEPVDALCAREGVIVRRASEVRARHEDEPRLVLSLSLTSWLGRRPIRRHKTP